jgi:hypothetical protein
MHRLPTAIALLICFTLAFSMVTMLAHALAG